MIDPRTPVIVGVAQANERESDSEPIAAMVQVVDDALVWSGAKDVLARQVGAVRVLQGLWSYRDPGRLVADDAGFGPVQTSLNPIGGNEVYDLVNTTANEIQAKRLDVAVLCAAEVGRTRRRRAKGSERPPPRRERDGAAPSVVYGNSKQLHEDGQAAVGAALPVNFYAMVESAIRHERGETVEAHRARIGALWARASEVAAHNPYASARRIVTGDEVAAVSPANRMIAAPYTKLMTANIDVDMSAAVILCSLETARAAGIADEQLVFVSAGSGACDHWSVDERWALHESPAMRAVGQRALALAGRSIDQIDDLDLYSCFPSAVELAQDYLGVDPERPYTITGGLTFAGGPFNSYCLHALATACDRIRAGRSTTALLTGNGGYFTKHSCTVLAAEPPEAGFRYDRPQDEVDAGPRRTRPTARPQAAELETYTVTYDRDGQPAGAILTALGADGGRHWATSTRSDVIGSLLADDRVGATVHLTGAPDGKTEVEKIR